MKTITSTDEWNEILRHSEEIPIIIAKLSATCSLSRFAQRELEELNDEFGDMIYRVAVQDARDASDAIESDLGIIHETPQVIIVHHGKAAYDADHEAIEASSVRDFLANLSHGE